MDAHTLVRALEVEFDAARAKFYELETRLEAPASEFQSATELIELRLQLDTQTRWIQAAMSALDHAKQKLKQANHGPEN
ncbi:MAG: hypothetical protein HQL96_17430 [Magnetococcales bacterium]|nr:hypothetical protein [Magnetococcales bacterium]